MLIPLGDDNPTRHIRHAYVNWAFITACVAVFLYQSSLDPRAGNLFVYSYGAIPAVMFGYGNLPDGLAQIPPIATLITSMFLHGGLMHLAGNMLFLWVLGDNVEDSTGHGRYLAFYLFCGIAAALSHAIVEPRSQIPMVGASGAISGAIGAYLLLHPHAAIRTLLFYRIVHLPAFVVLGLWIAFQVWNAATSTPDQPGVAWWAHVGGFVAGALLIVPFKRRGVLLFGRTPAARRRSILPDSESR